MMSLLCCYGFVSGGAAQPFGPRLILLTLTALPSPLLPPAPRTSGSSPLTTYIESAVGIKDGGRTGLVSLVVAFWFFLSLFFVPIISSVPPYATGPALIMVGGAACGSTQPRPSPPPILSAVIDKQHNQNPISGLVSICAVGGVIHCRSHQSCNDASAWRVDGGWGLGRLIDAVS